MSAQGALTDIVACEGVNNDSCRYCCGAQCTCNATRFFLSYNKQHFVLCCDQYAKEIFLDMDEVSFEDMLLLLHILKAKRKSR